MGAGEKEGRPPYLLYVNREKPCTSLSAKDVQDVADTATGVLPHFITFSDDKIRQLGLERGTQPHLRTTALYRSQQTRSS